MGRPGAVMRYSWRILLFHLSNPLVGSWIDRIVCQKTPQVGGEWNDGTYMGLSGTKAQDKHWAAVDWRNNNIYVTWTQFDEYGTSNPDYYSNIMFLQIVDGGMTWSLPYRSTRCRAIAWTATILPKGQCRRSDPTEKFMFAWAGPEGLVSTGRTTREKPGWKTIFSFPTLAGDGITPSRGFTGPTDCRSQSAIQAAGLTTAPSMSTGPTSRYGFNDTMYGWPRSTDGGDTWSDPIRVNDDPPPAPVLHLE